jgi:hypothetical protein
MKTHLNLMPMPYRRRNLIRRCLRRWSLVWLLAVFVLSLLAWTQWSQYRSGVVRLESRLREYAPIQELADETEQIQKRLGELQQREALSLSLADERSMLSLLGVLSHAAKSSGGQIAIAGLRFERRGDRPQQKNSVTLNGVAVDDFSVARFAAELREANAFSRVELKSTGDATVGKRNARTYSLECSY